MYESINDLQGHFFFGKSAGKDIYKNLENLKYGDTLTIVSPYLTRIEPDYNWVKKDHVSYYNDLLLELLERGVEVNLITGREDFLKKNSSTVERTLVDTDLLKLTLQKRKKIQLILLVFFIMLLFFSGFFSHILKVLLLIALGKFISLDVKIPKKTEKKEASYTFKKHYEKYMQFENKNFNLFVLDNEKFLHGKIFILNNHLAYIGSLNFTSSGFKKNYETRVKITDKRIVDDLIKISRKLMSNSKREKISDNTFLTELKKYLENKKK